MGKQVAKRRKPAWEVRDEPGCKGMERENTETYISLSLPTTLTSHLKGKCGERGRDGMRDLLRPRKPWHLLFGAVWVGKPGSDTLWDFPGQPLPRPQ